MASRPTPSTSRTRAAFASRIAPRPALPISPGCAITLRAPMSEWAARNYDYFGILSPAQQASSSNLTGPCYPVLFASTNVFWSCQLDDAPANATLALWQKAGGVEVNSGNVIVQVIQEALTTPSAVAKRYIADLGRAWPILVVCGGIAPLVLSVAYLVLVRYFVGLLTWLLIILLNALTLLVTLFFYIKAGWIGKDVVTGVIGNGADKVLSSSVYPPFGFIFCNTCNSISN